MPLSDQRYDVAMPSEVVGIAPIDGEEGGRIFLSSVVLYKLLLYEGREAGARSTEGDIGMSGDGECGEAAVLGEGGEDLLVGR